MYISGFFFNNFILYLSKKVNYFNIKYFDLKREKNTERRKLRYKGAREDI